MIDVFAVALHFQLLEKAGQQLQSVAVRHNGVIVHAEKIAVPDASQGQQQGYVFGSRRTCKVDINGACAGQKFRESLAADGQRHG